MKSYKKIKKKIKSKQHGPKGFKAVAIVPVLVEEKEEKEVGVSSGYVLMNTYSFVTYSFTLLMSFQKKKQENIPHIHICIESIHKSYCCKLIAMHVASIKNIYVVHFLLLLLYFLLFVPFFAENKRGT